MSLFLFGSAEAFVDRLHSFPCNEFQERLEKDGYDLIGPYKNNIVQLRHECGIEFCTTTEGFANGWSCPKCDSRKSEQEIFENLISYIDGGSYKPLLNYQGMNTKIEFLHTDCRKTTSMTPLDLLLSGKRCQCQAAHRKQALIDKLNENTQLTEGVNQYAHLNLRENTQVEALYRKNLVPEYNGNRFIEALPPPRSKDEAKETYRKPITTYDYDIIDKTGKTIYK